MKAAETVEIRVETHGKVMHWAVDLATQKVESLLRIAAEPVLSARVVLTEAADPAVSRPAVAQATIDMNGRVVRAQAAEPTMRLAIDQMADRLRVRFGRAARNWAARRGTMPTDEPSEWRHHHHPAHRPPYFPRPREERTVIGHASYTAGPQTPDEAIAEMGLLDYDFHLFIEAATGSDAVIYRVPGGYRLAMAYPDAGHLAGELPGSVTVSAVPAPTLTVREAADLLDATSDTFVFFTDTETGRGSVVYHRYDGHYGLLTPVSEG